jgi:hypothetical protein
MIHEVKESAMKSTAAHAESDPVLAALEAAPAVPLTEDEERALAAAKGESGEVWRTHDEVLKALAATKG